MNPYLNKRRARKRQQSTPPAEKRIAVATSARNVENKIGANTQIITIPLLEEITSEEDEKNSIGFIQISTKDSPRKSNILATIIPKCANLSVGNYVFVSSRDDDYKRVVEDCGGICVPYKGWEKDMSYKLRLGYEFLPEVEWIGILPDDIYPTDDFWVKSMKAFLAKKAPGQYGYRLLGLDGKRHPAGEDWMQSIGNRTKKLYYDHAARKVEQSNSAYVACCVVHKSVFEYIPPFGIFGKAPDVQWSSAIRSAGFPVDFNIDASMYHVGARRDYRK